MVSVRQLPLFAKGLKECEVCKEVKKLKFFAKRPTGKSYHGYDNRCLECRKQYQKEWHLKRNVDIRMFLYEYRIKNGCVDCGINDPRVLEFDHMKNKKFNLGKAHMIKGLTLTQLKREVKKCVVRCSNCHKIKTNQEQGTWLNDMFNKSQVKESSLD
jgi:hypothetical protein